MAQRRPTGWRPCKGTELVSGGGASTDNLPRSHPMRFAAATIGFLYVVVEEKTLTAQFIDDAGNVEFTRTLTKPWRRASRVHVPRCDLVQDRSDHHDLAPDAERHVAPDRVGRAVEVVANGRITPRGEGAAGAVR